MKIIMQCELFSRECGGEIIQTVGHMVQFSEYYNQGKRGIETPCNMNLIFNIFPDHYIMRKELKLKVTDKSTVKYLKAYKNFHNLHR